MAIEGRVNQVTWASIHDLAEEFDLKSDPGNIGQIKQELLERFLEVHPNATGGWQSEQQETLYHRLHKAREWLESSDDPIVIQSGDIVQLSASDFARIVQNQIKSKKARRFTRSEDIASQREGISRIYAFPKVTAATLASICTLLFGVTATAFTTHPAYNFLGRGLLLPRNVSPTTSIGLKDKMSSAKRHIGDIRRIEHIELFSKHDEKNGSTISLSDVSASRPLFYGAHQDIDRYVMISNYDYNKFFHLNGYWLSADEWKHEIDIANVLFTIYTSRVKRAAETNVGSSNQLALAIRQPNYYLVGGIDQLLQSAQKAIKEAQGLYDQDYMRRLAIARSRAEALLLLGSGLFGTAYILVESRERSDQRWIAVLATDTGLKYVYSRVASDAKDHAYSFSKSAFVAAATKKNVPFLLRYILGLYVDVTIVEPIASNMLSLLEERNAIRRVHLSGADEVYAINPR